MTSPSPFTNSLRKCFTISADDRGPAELPCVAIAPELVAAKSGGMQSSLSVDAASSRSATSTRKRLSTSFETVVHCVSVLSPVEDPRKRSATSVARSSSTELWSPRTVSIPIRSQGSLYVSKISTVFALIRTSLIIAPPRSRLSLPESTLFSIFSSFCTKSPCDE